MFMVIQCAVSFHRLRGSIFSTRHVAVFYKHSFCNLWSITVESWVLLRQQSEKTRGAAAKPRNSTQGDPSAGNADQSTPKAAPRHKNTECKREETASPKSCVPEGMSDTSKRGQRNVISRPSRAPPTPFQQPSNSEEATPSLGGIVRRGSVRSTEKATNCRVVPTQVPSASIRGSQLPTRRESQR